VTTTNQPTAAPRNVGVKTRTIVLPVTHPDTDEMSRQSAASRNEKSKVDVMLVNPPTPDGAIWMPGGVRELARALELPGTAVLVVLYSLAAFGAIGNIAVPMLLR